MVYLGTGKMNEDKAFNRLMPAIIGNENTNVIILFIEESKKKLTLYP